jgi:PAS domain S-box-containing protein
MAHATPPPSEHPFTLKTRQNILAALQESEARYRHLVESTSDGIYRINLPGYFLYANPIASRVLGGGTSIVGRHYLEFVRHDYHDDIRQFYARQVHDRVPATYYEFPAISADGREVWIGQRVHIELDDRDIVIGLHAIARDITERKQLEDELRQRDTIRAAYQLANGAVQNFTGLLTTIGSSADQLLHSLSPGDPLIQNAKDIRQAVDTAERLATQLLLPSAHTDTPSHTPLHRPLATSQSGVVLVADDEEGVRKILTYVLEANGYQVISAMNGVDALSKAKAHTGAIDLLLTDLVMPHMGGFELAEAFSNERPMSQILFMSGYVDQRGLNHRIGNAVRLLHKPFDSTTVLTEIQRMIPPSRLSPPHIPG